MYPGKYRWLGEFHDVELARYALDPSVFGVDVCGRPRDSGAQKLFLGPQEIFSFRIRYMCGPYSPYNNLEAPNRARRHARALAGGGHGCALRVPRAPGGDSVTAVWVRF